MENNFIIPQNMDNVNNYLWNMDENKELLSSKFGKFSQNDIFKFTTLRRYGSVRRKMDLHNWDSGINRDFWGHIGIRYL